MLPVSDQYLRSPCEVKTMENAPLLTGTLSNVADGEIQISGQNDFLPIIHCNTTVKVSIFNNTLGFKVLIGKVYLSTREWIRLSDVQSAADYEKRNFFRVRVSLAAEARMSSAAAMAPVNEAQKVGNDETFPIRIRDLSLSGLFFTSSKKIPLNTPLAVNFELYDTKISVLCKVLRPVPGKATEPDGYGCEFLDNSGSQFDLLCKYLFACQREQLRIARQNNF